MIIKFFSHGLNASLKTYDFINSTKTFTNIIGAISFTKEENIDLVIKDISMSEMNGIELIKLNSKN